MAKKNRSKKKHKHFSCAGKDSKIALSGTDKKKKRPFINLFFKVALLLIIICLTFLFFKYKYHSSSNISISKYLQAINNGQIDHMGPYMGARRSSKEINNWPNIEKDSKGVPLVHRKEVDRKVRHPVFIAQRLLINAWGNGLRPEEPRWKEIRQVIEIMATEEQREDGIFPYPFPFLAGKYKYQFPVGWGSSMAQGQLLSVMARLYASQEDREQSDPKLRNYALKTMKPLERHFKKGGLMQWFCIPGSEECLVWYAEYPTDPPVYTLNGYIFTLIGLYDWARANQDEKAAKLFWDGIATLEKVLPLYDNRPVSAYDLSHYSWIKKGVPPNCKLNYHLIHIRQLEWLSKATCSEKWSCIASVWSSYISSTPSKRESLRKQCFKYFPESYWDPVVPFDKISSQSK